MEPELPHPDVLWARARELGGTYASIGGDSRRASETDGCTNAARPVGSRLVTEDGAGNWFALVHLDRGHALLFGGDKSSDLYETQYDPWADAPEWALVVDRSVDHPRLFGDICTFVRWWDGQQWHRTPFTREVIGDLAGEPDVSDGLSMGLRKISGRWFPGGSPTMDRSEAVVAARNYRPREPGMRYRRVRIEHAKLTEPVEILIEINSTGHERRKVEYFSDGSIGGAGIGFSTSTTRRSRNPVESMEQTSQRPGSTAVEISSEEFQVEWVIAFGEGFE